MPTTPPSLTDSVIRMLLNAFPGLRYLHTYREYRAGYSGARVLAAAFQPIDSLDPERSYIVKIHTKQWADAEESFYAEEPTKQLDPFIVQLRARSNSSDGQWSGMAYDVAFESVLAVEPLNSLLSEQRIDDILGQRHITQVSRGLAQWYSSGFDAWRQEQLSTGSIDPGVEVKGGCHSLLLELLGSDRTADLHANLREHLLLDNMDAATMQVDGLVRPLPNPLAYLRPEVWPSAALAYHPRTLRCRIHGDLHSGNILCLRDIEFEAEATPKLIDFALTVPNGIPFFDLAYLEFDVLQQVLPVSSDASRRHWLELLELSMRNILLTQSAPWQAETARRLIVPIRAKVDALLAQSPAGHKDAELDWWLSTIAAGLNWARKGGRERLQPERLAGLIYAAYGLERALACFDERVSSMRKPLLIPWLDTSPSQVSHQRRDFYAHVPKPKVVVERSVELDTLRTALVQSASTLAAPDSAHRGMLARLIALHGAGGIGKSVLARLLCDDRSVQRAFPDGILWTSLGQLFDPLTRESKLRDKISEWIQWLGGGIPGVSPTLDLLKNALADALDSRSCLLIVDDVWEQADLEYFCIDCPHCSLLFTTRNRLIATNLNAQVYKVPPMTDQEALDLLERSAHGALRDTSYDTKMAIIERLEYLPLAIRLAGPQLEGKDPDTWLENLHAERLRLSVGTTYPDAHYSLQATLELSLRELQRLQEPRELRKQARTLYMALSIFPEDESVPFGAIRYLWQGLAGLDKDTTTEFLELLHARALLDIAGAGEGQRIVVHDLIRELLAVRFKAQSQRAHHALLRAYWAVRRGDGWHTVPHDDNDYLFEHLAYHLTAVQTGNSHEYDTLELLFTDDRWLRARVEQRNYAYDGYVSDLYHGWQIALRASQDGIAGNREPATFDLCLRYLLIRATINSMAANFEPELVAQAVAMGLWTPERALSIAARIPSLGQRITMYAAIAETGKLTKQQVAVGRSRVLELLDKGAMAGIESDAKREPVLSRLARGFGGEVISHTLNASLAFDHAETRAATISALAPHLSKEQLTRALEVAQRLHEEAQVRALSALAPYLTEEQRKVTLENALEVTRAIRNAEDRAAALSALAPHLSKEQLTRALETALAIWDEDAHSAALSALAPYLAGQQVGRALQAAWVIWDAPARVKALSALASHLRSEQLARVLQGALDIGSPGARAAALSALAPHLSKEQLTRALETARRLHDEEAQVRALSALAPYLGKEQLTRALEVAQRLHEEAQVRALSALAPYLTEEQRKVTLENALEVTRAIRNAEDRAAALSALAPHLSKEQLTRALETARRLHDEEAQVRALSALAPHLIGQKQQVALGNAVESALAISDAIARAAALSALAPHLTGLQLTRALEIAQNIEGAWARASALSALIPHLTGPVRHVALTNALGATRAIQDAGGRVAALSTLIPHLTGREREVALESALEATLDIGGAWQRVRALSALAPYLGKEQLTRALEVAQRLHDAEARAAALSALIPYLADQERQVALASALGAARRLRDAKARSTALSTLIPHLTGREREIALESALEATLDIDAVWPRVRAMSLLVPQLSSEQLARVLQGALDIGSPGARAAALSALAPYLSKEQLTRALEVAQRLHDAEARAAALSALAPYVTEEQRKVTLENALEASLDIGRSGQRVQALSAIGPIIGTLSDGHRRYTHMWPVIINSLERLQDKPRDTALDFLGLLASSTWSVASERSAAYIASLIAEICDKWKWI